MRIDRYLFWSIISGCCWAVLALCINLVFLDRILWGGLIVAPVIGVLMGLVARPFHHRPIVLRAVVAVVSLYVAVGLFGGAAALMSARGDDSIGESLLGGALSVIGGIMIYPLWVVLIPAAIINHYLLGMLVADARRGIGRSQLTTFCS